MDCLKNLSARLFLCFAVLVGYMHTSVLDVKAEEIAKTTKATEAMMVAGAIDTIDTANNIEVPEIILVSPTIDSMLVETSSIDPSIVDSELLNSVLLNPTLPDAALPNLAPTDLNLPDPALADPTLVTNDEETKLAELEFQRLAKRSQDVETLSRLIQTEGGYAFEDKVCVALTVLHRVDNPDFPDTIEETINEPSQYADLAQGDVLEENALAAEYAMEAWENGTSYSILPSQFLFFHGNGKKNSFHDYHGQYYKLPKLF